MIVKRRPLFDENSPLKNIPTEWLKYVEPKVSRPDDMQCWLWTGAVTNNMPVMRFQDHRGKRQHSYIRRLVASMFFAFPPVARIRNSCGVDRCVRPSHIIVEE